MDLETVLFNIYPVFLIPIFVLIFYEYKHSRTVTSIPPGCRKLGVTGRSNLSDEYVDRSTATKNESGAARNSIGKVKALYIYPIKSCAPLELDVADIDTAGMAWDRQFAFAEYGQWPASADKPTWVREPRWDYLSQRDASYDQDHVNKLVHIKTEVWIPDARAVKNITYGKPDKFGRLVIRYPNIPRGPFKELLRVAIWLGLEAGEKSFSVPLVPPPDHDYPSENVTIWKESPYWLNYGKELPEDFKVFLSNRKGRPITLFRVDPSRLREVFRCAPRKKEVGFQPVVGFADAYPLHLLTVASVQHIGAREPVKKEIARLSVRRFRANIIVDGFEAFDEDDWKRIRIGDREDIFCSCRTVRCKMPNVDPDTGVRSSNQPSAEMANYRAIDAGCKGGACLGLQLVAAKPKLQIRVGEKVEVLERGEHLYINQGDFVAEQGR